MDDIALYLSQTVAGVLSVLSKGTNVCSYLAVKQLNGCKWEQNFSFLLGPKA